MTLFTVSSLGFRTSPLSPLFPYTTLFRSSYALARLATKGSCLLRSTRETLRSGSQSLNPQLQLHYRLWPCFHSHQTRQNWSQAGFDRLFVFGKQHRGLHNEHFVQVALDRQHHYGLLA